MTLRVRGAAMETAAEASWRDPQRVLGETLVVPAEEVRAPQLEGDIPYRSDAQIEGRGERRSSEPVELREIARDGQREQKIEVGIRGDGRGEEIGAQRREAVV